MDSFSDVEESTVVDFFEEFFAECFAHDFVSADIIYSTTLLLKSAFEHPAIAIHDVFKMYAMKLISSIINPLIILLRGFRRAVGTELHVQEDLDPTLVKSIDTLLRLVASGLDYKLICQQLAEEFIYIFETHHEICVEAGSHLKSYKKMLMIEVR